MDVGDGRRPRGVIATERLRDEAFRLVVIRDLELVCPNFELLTPTELQWTLVLRCGGGTVSVQPPGYCVGVARTGFLSERSRFNPWPFICRVKSQLIVSDELCDHDQRRYARRRLGEQT
jgi:hypothetical protein